MEYLIQPYFTLWGGDQYCDTVCENCLTECQVNPTDNTKIIYMSHIFENMLVFGLQQTEHQMLVKTNGVINDDPQVSNNENSHWWKTSTGNV